MTKRKVFISILSFITTAACSAQQSDDGLSVEERIACLIPFVSKSVMSVQEKKQLFECFPSNSRDLSQVFSSTSTSSLADGGVIIMERLPATKEVVGKENYIKKVVAASVGLSGFADTPSYIRHLLEVEFKNGDAGVAFNELDKLSKRDLTAFWNFYFTRWEGIELDPTICSGNEHRESCKSLTAMIEDRTSPDINP